MDIGPDPSLQRANPLVWTRWTQWPVLLIPPDWRVAGSPDRGVFEMPAVASTGIVPAPTAT